MTISLEEHVARAMALINRPGMRWEQRGAEPEAVRQEYFAMARAAIAAVHEREGDPAEATRAKCDCARYEYCDVCWPKDKRAALKDNGERE